MSFILFSVWFTIIHIASYTLAGVLALRVSKDLYQGKNRLLDFLRDPSDDSEGGHVQKLFIPIQVIRGILMSIVLYPILGPLGDISVGARITFFAGLMFIYTDFASAVPFPNNLEGFVYMKRRYVRRSALPKLYYETVIYSLLFGVVTGSLLF